MKSHWPFEPQSGGHQLQRQLWPEVDLLMPLLHNYTSKLEAAIVRVPLAAVKPKAAAATDELLQFCSTTKFT